jgi:hypothetical protein
LGSSIFHDSIEKHSSFAFVNEGNGSLAGSIGTDVVSLEAVRESVDDERCPACRLRKRLFC